MPLRLKNLIATASRLQAQLGALTASDQPALARLAAEAQAAAGMVERWAQAFLIYDLTRQIVLTAARAVRDHRLNYWDAQIWATALLNQVPVIFSEDFASGTSLEGVRFVNPFAGEFVLEHWA